MGWPGQEQEARIYKTLNALLLWGCMELVGLPRQGHATAGPPVAPNVIAI